MQNNQQQTRLRQKLQAEMGPVVTDALHDPNVIEIMLNADGHLWVERFGQDRQLAGEMTAVDARAFMNSLADSLNTTLSTEKPRLSGALSLLGGHRFQGWIPPIVNGPAFTIRKKAIQIFTLEHYVKQGVMAAAQQALLIDAIAQKQNVLVVGGTGSGKTTLTNALISQIASDHPKERPVIIEDTAEIQCASPNYLILAANSDTTMEDLLFDTLRARPDRIVVGEVRGAEALTLLKAWNTGHPGGIATLHANHALAALTRLEHLVAEGGAVMGIPELIGEVIDVVVVINKCKSDAGRKITEILTLTGYHNSQYQYQFLYQQP